MKFFVLFITFFLCLTAVSEAQLRDDLQHGSDYSGVITHEQRSSSVGNWMNMLNMTMSHSYTMSFSNIGGQMQNLNAYTNSMMFDISDRLDARVDISLLHSPFGNNFMSSNSGLGSQIIIDSARLDYQISDNAHITVEFSQRPYRYSPFGNYGYGMGGGYYSPWNRQNIW